MFHTLRIIIIGFVDDMIRVCVWQNNSDPIAISGECCWNNYAKYVDIRSLLLPHSVYKTCPLSALRCDWWIKLIRDSSSSNILFTCFSCQYSWTNPLLNDIFSFRLSVFSCFCFCFFKRHLHFFYFCILLQCIALSQQLCGWNVGLKVKIIIPSHTFFLCMKQAMIWVTLTKLLFRTTIGQDYHSTITFNIVFSISGNVGFSVFFSVVYKDQLGAKCYQISAAVAFVHSCLMNVFPLTPRLHLRQFVHVCYHHYLLFDLRPVFFNCNSLQV